MRAISAADCCVLGQIWPQYDSTFSQALALLPFPASCSVEFPFLCVCLHSRLQMCLCGHTEQQALTHNSKLLLCFQALSVGIFPYVLKLLQSSARELRPLLVFIWAKILAVDSVSYVKHSHTLQRLYFISSKPLLSAFLHHGVIAIKWILSAS